MDGLPSSRADHPTYSHNSFPNNFDLNPELKVSPQINSAIQTSSSRHHISRSRFDVLPWSLAMTLDPAECADCSADPTVMNQPSFDDTLGLGTAAEGADPASLQTVAEWGGPAISVQQPLHPAGVPVQPGAPLQQHAPLPPAVLPQQGDSLPPGTINPAQLADGNFGGNAALDLMRKKKTPLAAIFVHAGAGFHSHTNEHFHLEACNRAARAGMVKMKQGGSAVEGVVEAIKSLENNSITNAGLGSNLCIDGNVECDATVVDHNGRSGAVGAVPNIRNPIELASKILEQSVLPLPLRRIPPVLLCGAGARDYAIQHNVTVVHNSELVSENALDRYNRWNEELMKMPPHPGDSVVRALPVMPTLMPQPVNAAGPAIAHPDSMRDHVSAIMTGTFNEGQPDSPMPAPDTAVDPRSPGMLRGRANAMIPLAEPSLQQPALGEGPPLKRPRLFEPNSMPEPPQIIPGPRPMPIGLPRPNPPRFDRADSADSLGSGETKSLGGSGGYVPRDDDITDTVGVIAIDSLGHIAAGSSSGGIGMKHTGRVGPAALVGVGTAVIPAAPLDKRQTTVAVVTSGTGEHMATGMAGHRCAERLYLSTVRGPDGSSQPAEGDDDSVLSSFISNDFMGHPGVRGGDSRPAIGVMAVKKVDTGYYFYFGHNTESFALASMSANERSPKCVMSRVPEVMESGVARPVQCVMRGGRKIAI